MVVRSDVLIDRRYLAIRRAKQKAQIRSRERKIYRSALSAAKHCRRRPVGRRNGGGALPQTKRKFSPPPAPPPPEGPGGPPHPPQVGRARPAREIPILLLGEPTTAIH